MKILTHLNLSQNELQNAVLHKLATAPATPVVGQIYYNTVEKKAYIYHETGWENLGLSEALIAKLESVEEGADKVLYGELPAAADNNGKVVIYTGAATEDLTPGLVYVSNGTEWIEASPSISGTETDTAIVTVTDGAIATEVKVSEDATNAIQIKEVDGVSGLYVEATDISAATEDEDGLMTSDDKKKLNALSEKAEENVIDEVKVNGVALAATDKAVNVEVAAADNSLTVATDDAGKVTVAAKISATADNSLSVKDDGLYVAVPEIVVPEYSVIKDETAEAGAIATYHLTKNGVNVGAAINVPKDFLVKSASVEEVAEVDVPYAGAQVGDKYLDFVVNVKAGEAEEDAHIYLPVNELVDVYTAGNGIEISAANVVSAKVVAENGLSVDENGIKLGLANADAAGAMSKEHFAKVEAIEAGAQVNKIEIVKVNDVALEINAEDKSVNVTMPTVTTTTDGLMNAADKVALDKAVTDIADHETRVAALETKATTQGTELTTVKEQITALQNKDTELVEDIAELVAKDTEIAGKVAANETAIAGKQDKLTAGNNIEITEANVINAILPTATTTTLGMVQIGTGLAINEAGVVTVTGAAEADSVDWANVKNKPSTLGAENGPVGTFQKVTVDKYGLVTAGENLTAEDLPDLSAEYIAVEEKGAANGVATLDANSKIVLSQLPDTVLGNVRYGGTFDPKTGVCTLVDGKILGADKTEYTQLTIDANNAANFKGYYFLATDTATLVGVEFLVGDWCISNGTAGWAKVDNTDAVTGVKGDKEDTFRIGQVNITAANVGAVEANAAITGGTFAKVTVDAKGLVTAGEEKLSIEDIEDFNAADYVPATIEGSSNQVLVTDKDGKVTTVAHKYVQAIGNGSAKTFAVVHNMGTKDVIVQVSTADTYEVVYANTAITDENTVTLTFAQAPATEAYRVIIIA